jgi:hypothetical protein
MICSRLAGAAKTFEIARDSNSATVERMAETSGSRIDGVGRAMRGRSGEGL